jgi:hypothetical protein
VDAGSIPTLASIFLSLMRIRLRSATAHQS